MNKTKLTISALGLVGVGFLTGNTFASNEEYKKIDNDTIEITKPITVQIDIDSLKKQFSDIISAKGSVQNSCNARLSEFDDQIKIISDNIYQAKKLGIE